MNKTSMRAGIAILMATVLVSCGSGTNKETETTTTTTEQAKPVETPSPWKYGEQVDEMSSGKIYDAYTTALNKIDFKSPYSGGSTFTLTVRKMPAETQVLLSMDKGHFIFSSGTQKVRLKFDDAEAVDVVYHTPSDVSANIIGLEGAEQVVAKLKSAKSLLVECQFFQEGAKIIKFDVTGLKWDH